VLRTQLREDLAAIVEVEIQLPSDLRRQRRAEGLHFESVAGSALIDTGADVTAFDLAAAARAGLAHSGAGRSMTVQGSQGGEVPLLLGEVAIADLSTFSVPQGRGFDLSHLGLVAVIGRDVLRRTILVYNGREGWATLSRDGN
jgi:hypothetical protein